MSSVTLIDSVSCSVTGITFGGDKGNDDGSDTGSDRDNEAGNDTGNDTGSASGSVTNSRRQVLSPALLQAVHEPYESHCHSPVLQAPECTLHATANRSVPVVEQFFCILRRHIAVDPVVDVITNSTVRRQDVHLKPEASVGEEVLARRHLKSLLPRVGQHAGVMN